ncbi:MAG: hypothetical protein KGY43_05345, partial [Halodesulfurarchaeum sp.]|nr:hypothetical protein [Halodesulfurarchaeum sp.]
MSFIAQVTRNRGVRARLLRIRVERLLLETDSHAAGTVGNVQAIPRVPIVISHVGCESVDVYHILLPADMNKHRTEAQAAYVLNLPVEPAKLEVTVLYVLPRSDAKVTNESGFEGNESAVRAANRLEGWEITVNRTVRAGKPVSGEILP